MEIIKLIKKDGYFYRPEDVAKCGYRTKITEDYVANHYRKLGVGWAEIDGLLKLTFNNAEEKREVTAEDKENDIKEIIIESKLFSNFKILKNSKKLVVYETKDTIEILGGVDSLNAKDLVQLFASFHREDFLRTMDLLSPYINPKSPSSVTDLDVVQKCLNVIRPTFTLPVIELDTEDIHPAVVEGCNVPSLLKIPYHETNITFEQLNPYLQEFLTRVDNHKHLCAILWGQFTGYRWPYMCYMFGKNGREGKTSFIKMLENLTKSCATLTDDSRFAFYPLYGKSIITVPENERSRLVNSRVVKGITGGNSVSIEAKGKTPFNGSILGTIIVDANVPLKILGRDFEIDRLRYFNVSSHNLPNDKRLGPNEYIRELSSTPNEFLNYCRQCFDELRTPGGMLKEPDNHRQIMESLADIEQEYEFEQVFQRLCKEMSLKQMEGLSCKKAEVLSKARRLATNKKEFYMPSFEHYLEKQGIIVSDKLLINLGFAINESKGTQVIKGGIND